MGRWAALLVGIAAMVFLAGWAVGTTRHGIPTAVAEHARVDDSAEHGEELEENDDEADDEEAAPEKRRYVVAAMGDSLTDPKSHGGKYLELLRKRCPKSRFDSYGKGGNMVNQMRRRFARDVLGLPKREGDDPKPKYSHVIVLGGINDICSDESAKRTNDKIEADLRKMYRMAKAHDIAVIALTLPPWAGFKQFYNERRGASTHAMNRWIAKQLKTPDVDSMLDIYPLLSCGDPEYLCEDYGWPDKVHWNAKGHEVVGKALHAHDFSDCL